MSARNSNQTTTNGKPGKPIAGYSFGATQTGSWGIANPMGMGGTVSASYSTAVTELYA